MEKRAILDQLLTEISEILDDIQNQRKTISADITPQVLGELEWIESSINIVQRYQQEAFLEANIDINRVTQEVIESTTANPRDKQLLKRAQNIERDAMALHLALSKAIERGKGRKKSKNSIKKEGNTKEQMKERRKLFKPLGGDKNWIPL